ncbi:YIP1 family protein [Amylibacter sp.]|jgi:hypothetical protein|nr:YIP1 family protein [Amylibacter sp.]
MKRYLEDGIREEQTLFFAILFGLLSFLSLLPALAKHAFLTNESLSALAAAQFISSVFMMPLLMYGIAAVSHLILKYFGGQGDYIGARRALFWAALVTTPAILLTSIAEAYFSEISTILSVITTMIFVWQWVSNLKELEFNNV